MNKRWRYFLILLGLIVIIAIVFIIFVISKNADKVGTIERITGVKVESSAEIIEYLYEPNYRNGDIFAAKVRISYNNYEHLKENTLKKYDFTEEGIYFSPIELFRIKENVEWWDLSEEDIVEYYFHGSSNRRPVKHIQSNYIIASLQENDVILYFYSVN